MIRGQSGGSGSPGKPHWLLLLQNTKYKRRKIKEKEGKRRETEGKRRIHTGWFYKIEYTKKGKI